jgi:hypothetical protein
VHIPNALHVLQGSDAHATIESNAQVRRQKPAQRAHTVERRISADGVEAELWIIHGASSAWSGGSSRATFKDVSGPDASAEMMQFFPVSSHS